MKAPLDNSAIIHIVTLDLVRSATQLANTNQWEAVEVRLFIIEKLLSTKQLP